MYTFGINMHLYSTNLHRYLWVPPQCFCTLFLAVLSSPMM